MSIQQSHQVPVLSRNERRRINENGDSSTLKSRLYALLKEKSCTDVELIVTTENGDVKRLPAHKIILVAMSSVFATKLTRRWEEGGKGRDVVEIPSDVGVDGVDMFLKFLYTEELDENLSVDLWLELIFLADYYQVQNLFDLCDDKLIYKLNLENCIKIYEKSRLFQDVQCAKSAYKLLKKSLSEILEKFPNSWIQMDASTWKIILEFNYLPNLEEIELFKVLKRWKEENVEERYSDFQKLAKLIRLPLIGYENFSEIVFPSLDLDTEMIKQMFDYFAGKGPVPEQFDNCQPRNLLAPKDSEELQKFIYKSQNGDIIELKGTYSSFVIPETKTNLTIRGKKGAEAIIKTYESGIKIYGRKCKFDQILIISNNSKDDSFVTASIFVAKTANQNDFRNIKIIGGYRGFIIHGNENSFSNISIIDITIVGVFIDEQSSKNKISECSVIIKNKDLFSVGFFIAGFGQNKLNNLSSENTYTSSFYSGQNFVNGFKIFGGGLTILNDDNHVENVRITGNNSNLGVLNKSKNVIIDHCRADNIIIEGNYQTVKNSKAKKILIEGKVHKFYNCEAESLKLALDADIESTKCIYQVTEHDI